MLRILDVYKINAPNNLVVMYQVKISITEKQPSRPINAVSETLEGSQYFEVTLERYLFLKNVVLNI